MPRPSPITEKQEAEVVRLYLEGKGRNELATMFGASGMTITRRLQKHGVRVRTSPQACIAKLRHGAFANAENDPEAAYWAGFLMADGCVSEQRHSPHVILVLGERDQSHAQRFLSFLGSKNRAQRVPPRGLQVNACCRVDVASTQLVADLARYGIVPRKTATAQVKILDRDPHFWRGVVDGDGSLHLSIRRNPFGCFYKARPVLQVCGSASLMRQFAIFASEITGATARPHRDKSISAIGLTCGRARKMIEVLYQNCPVALSRKLSIANQLLATL